MKKNISYAAIPAPVTCLCKAESLPHYFTLHAHNGFEILLFLGGNVGLYYEKDSVLMRPGDIILIPPYVFHRGYQNDSSPYVRDILNIQESFAFPGREDDFRRLLNIFFTDNNQKIKVLHPDPTTFELIHKLMGMTEKTLAEPVSPDSIFLRDTLTAQILIILNRACSQRAPDSGTVSWDDTIPPFIAGAFRFIDEHLTEELSLDAIANVVHINKYYLCRVFHEFTGGSIGQYIIEKRLSLAKQLIKRGATATEACFRSGFNNYSNFSRTFSRHTGLSPKTYQKTMHISGMLEG